MHVDILSRMPLLRRSKSTGKWYLRDRVTREIIPGTVGDKSHAAECITTYGMLTGEYSIIDLRALPWTRQIPESYGHNSWNGKCDTRNMSHGNVPVLIRIGHIEGDIDGCDIGVLYVHLS